MWGLALADSGRDQRSSDSLRGIVFFSQKNAKNCSQNFQVLQLQAIITPQWLQIAGNTLSICPFTWCLVSIFIVRILSKSFLWNERSVQERYLPKFSATSDNRYCVFKTNSTSQCWCGLARDIFGAQWLLLFVPCPNILTYLLKSWLNWRLKISNTADSAGIT